MWTPLLLLLLLLRHLRGRRLMSMAADRADDRIIFACGCRIPHSLPHAHRIQ